MKPNTTWNKKFKDLSDKLGTTTNSECLTEGIVRAIFEICKPQNKWCVEVGAFDGISGSNTYSFIKEGWKSLQIEAMTLDRLKETYKNNLNVFCHKAFIKTDYFGTVDDFSNILDRYQVPLNFDLLSLDIDGIEYEIWKFMRYKPNIMIVECNADEPDFNVINYDPSYSVKALMFDGYNSSRYGGATVGLLNKLAEHTGYELVCVDKHDAVYIRKEFSTLLNI